jgi:putative redox protein
MSEPHTEPRRIAHASAKLASMRYRTEIKARRFDLVADEPASAGGEDAGPRPFEYVLAGLGACTAITLRMYAERKAWKLTGLIVDLDYYRDGEAFRIERVLHIEGELDDAQRARLADIAERTPVTLALKAANTIDTRIG